MTNNNHININVKANINAGLTKLKEESLKDRLIDHNVCEGDTSGLNNYIWVLLRVDNKGRFSKPGEGQQ